VDITKGEKQMTKQELIKMAGNEDQAEYAISVLLKNVKPEFVRICMKNELERVKEEIKKYMAQGYIVIGNEHYRVDWGKPERPFQNRKPGWGFHITPEEEKILNEGKQKCRDAEFLIYEQNRLNSWLYHN
jgi:hypothetical protein